MKNGIITEEDKIYDLIIKFPQLKDTLIKMNPVFEKLNNKIAFNTVAKVTTVKTAAKIGKIYLNQFLLELNESIGKEKEFLKYKKKELNRVKGEVLSETFGIENKEPPVWLDNTEGFKIFDYSERDEEPFLEVTRYASLLKLNEGFILIQKFEPLPLINYLGKLGFDYFTDKLDNSKYKVYFYKTNQGEKR